MKTMKHTIAKYFAAAAALCLTVVGCSTLQEDKGVSESRDIKFSASIGSYQVKATDTAFENGDAMGLYAQNHVQANNLRLTWQDGALTPETPIQWGWEQMIDESTLFYAYYPYTSQPDIEDNQYLYFSVQKDQSTHAAYTASDLMTASTYATPAEGTVNFTFVHRLAKLVLTIENRLEDPVKEVYIGNILTSGFYDIINSQDYGSTGELGNIKAGKGYTAEGTEAWSVILPSQSAYATLMLVTESGKEYVYKSENSVYFAAARRHTAHVILDETAVSASFSANIYDWIDNGDFWFKQPNPLYDGQWTMIGTFGGSNWDRDLAMNQDGNTWYSTEVVLHAGNEFKFRKDYAWEVDFGAQAGSTVSGNWGSINLVQAGSNFFVEEGGIYNIYLFLDEGYMYFWKTGELPAVEGTQIWSGAKIVEGWNFNEKNSYFGDEDVWVKEGLKVGDEIRVYYERNPFVYMGYWEFLVAPKTWNVQTNYYSKDYNYSCGYVPLYVTEQWYKELTDVQGWGGALVCIGEGVVITAISFGEPSTPPATNGWSLIGSIMGTEWDKDFEMFSWADWGLNCWSIDIDYQAGDSFKFRKDGDWTENLGVGSEWTVNEDGSYTMILAPDMDNITLPKEGKWSLWLDVDNKTLSATYQGSSGQPVSGGTESQPFNVYQAIEYIDAGGSDQVFVEGIISKIVYTFDTSHGTATFWISRDGKFYDDHSRDFEAYSVYWLGNTSWVDGNQQIEIGDKVIICGQLTKYQDSIYETAARKAYIHAIGKNVWNPAQTKLASYWYSPADWSGGLTPSIETLDNGFTIVVPDNIGGAEWMGQNQIYNPYNPKGDKYYHFECNLYSQNYDGSLCTVKLAEYENDIEHEMTYWNNIKLPYNNGYTTFYPLYSGVDYTNGLALILDLGRCKPGEIVTISDIKLFEF